MSSQIRVLVVADDADTRSQTARALHRIGGFDTRSASSVTSALSQLARDDTSHAPVDISDRPVDCLVTDHTPPTVDALALTESAPVRDDVVPIVLFPSDGDEHLAGNALAAGVDGYVPNTGTDDAMELLTTRVREAVAANSEQTKQRSRFDYYRAIVETMLDGAHIIDDSGERVYFNGRSSFVHDIDPERLSSEAPGIFVDEGIMSQSDLDHYTGVIKDLLSDTRESASVEMELNLPNGGKRTVETRLTRLDGTPLRGVVGTTRDVTDRVQTERRLADRNDQLTNLAGFFSHDLRNPLSVAIGYAELARETGDPAHFDRLDDALARIDALVDDLLVLMTQSVADLDQADVSLATVARRAWENVDTDEATLVVESDQLVHANEGLLLRLFENLFRNSVEHGDGNGSAGPLTVTVRDTDGGFVVDDDGSGFPDDPEALLEIGASGGNGTGLGLAIITENASAHEWNVTLDTSPSGGARVRFDTAGQRTEAKETESERRPTNEHHEHDQTRGAETQQR